MAFLRELAELYAFREVLRNLVSSDLKLRFRRSFLGYGWSLLYPVLTMLILAAVFSRIMKFESAADMVLYVFAGLVPWNFFVGSCLAGGNSVLDNEALLKKIYLPKLIFPLSVLFARFVDFLFNLVALFIIVSFISFKPSWALLTLPGAVLILFLFIDGVTVALAAINVYVRDASHLMAVVFQLAFYLTPIIYREELVPEHLRALLECNPLVHIIRLFHAILSNGEVPSLQQWGLGVGVAVAAAGVGHWIFVRLERNLIFRL
ncbi:MAG: ABC transporter permease [Planctomycetota bacterium]|nr:ABC transporter permease [Planctomycetota bacterium]